MVLKNFRLSRTARRESFRVLAWRQNATVQRAGKDFEQLRQALRALVERSGRSVRSLETEIGVGHGTLGNMLRGRTELRLRHLDHLCRALGVSLQELLAQAFAEPLPEPRSRHSKLRNLVAEVVRQELEGFWDRHFRQEWVAESEEAGPL